ncbi:MAG TPA: hypothetical protein VNK91_01325 [Burkholderiaceae bacterium]|jgi:hypothetical protein|nr:hypothetical protein [Burkholderiaceae bacterium]
MRALVPLLALLVAACTPTFDWRETHSTEGGYRVALPGKPQAVTRELELPLPAGERKVAMTMTSAGAGPTMFAVGVARLPADAARDGAAVHSLLAWVRAGLLRNIGADSATDGEAALAPSGGRTLRGAIAFEARGRLARAGAAAQPARLAARIYVVDDRLYQVVAMGAADELPDAAVETFFTSFRLTP